MHLHTKNMVPMGRIELPTSPLPRECSTTEPHGQNLLPISSWSGWRESNPRHKLGRLQLYHWATPAAFYQIIRQQSSLKSLNPLLCQISVATTVKLNFNSYSWWRELDSNQRRRKPTDLQSAPFSRSGISPGTKHFLLFGHYCQSASPSFTSENAQTVGVWASHIGARQLPTFTRVIRTIIGVESFHGPVRDGKGWFQLAMVTGRRGWGCLFNNPIWVSKFG